MIKDMHAMFYLSEPETLRLNFEMALNNGATLTEIFEALFQVAVHAGLPATWDALEMLAEVVRERPA